MCTLSMGFSTCNLQLSISTISYKFTTSDNASPYDLIRWADEQMRPRFSSAMTAILHIEVEGQYDRAYFLSFFYKRHQTFKANFYLEAKQTISQNVSAAFANCLPSLPVWAFPQLKSSLSLLTMAQGQEDTCQKDPSCHTVSQGHLEMSFKIQKRHVDFKFTSRQRRSARTENPLFAWKRTKAAEFTFIVVFPPWLSWKLDRKWCSGCVYSLPVKSKRGLKWLGENRGGENALFKSASLSLWIAARFEPSCNVAVCHSCRHMTCLDPFLTRTSIINFYQGNCV